MNKVALGFLAFAVLAAFCFIPAGADAEGQITTDDGDVIEVSKSATFTIKYDLSDADKEKDLSYSAKVVNDSGKTQSGAVSPSTGSLSDGVEKDLTVTAPSTAGKYKLVVEFLLDDEPIDGEKASEYTFKAVEPIVLKVNLKAKDVTLNLQDFGVYFYIDGEKMEDSYTTVSLAADGTGSVSYNWIADPDSSKHTFKVVAVGGSTLISGLDVEHTFYAEDTDYTWIVALSGLFLIILIALAIWIYRKPIKNYGKPKARR